jgi:hypothetical protein
MNTKKILVRSLLAGGVLALLRLAFARVPSAKPASKPSSYASDVGTKDRTKGKKKP